MSIGELCNRDVIVAEQRESIRGIALLMREHHVGSVIIVEKHGKDSIPVGIITDRDIVLQLVAPDVNLDQISAADVMSRDLAVAQESDREWDTIRMMRIKGVRRIPVVNCENALVGIVTVDDLLEVLTGELNELVKLVALEQTKERRRRPDI